VSLIPPTTLLILSYFVLLIYDVPGMCWFGCVTPLCSFC